MDIIYIIFLFFTFVAGESRNLKFASYSLIPQGLLIVLSLMIVGYVNNLSHFYVIAAVDLLVRVFLMPAALIILLRVRLQKEEKPAIIHPLSIALSIVLLSVGYKFIDTIKIMNFPNILSFFTAGATAFIYGMFLFLSKRDMVKMIISFFIIENGIHLILLSMLPKVGKAVEFGLTINFIVAVIFFIYITLRYNLLSVMEFINKIKKES